MEDQLQGVILLLLPNILAPVNENPPKSFFSFSVIGIMLLQRAVVRIKNDNTCKTLKTIHWICKNSIALSLLSY